VVEEVLVAVVVDMEVVARHTVAAEVVAEATAVAAAMAHHEEVVTVVDTGREDLDIAPTRIVEREMSKGCDPGLFEALFGFEGAWKTQN
jgi:hypothetical protein